MRELSVAYGRSRETLTWFNRTVTWERLCEQLKTTRRTKETVAQYHSMTKDQKDAIKNGRGFVMGRLRDGLRRVENVEYRSGLTTDVDDAGTEFLSRFLKEWRHAAAVYTTHGHTPEKPRLRVVVPLTCDVSPEEYVAVTRYFAEMWGIEKFDECSFRVNQLMYLPTTPADGEFIFETIDGSWLDPDEFLAKYPDWRDCTKHPVSSREKKKHDSDGRKQQDPLKKDGIEGAFCRTYTVTDAIETFLFGIYEPCNSDDRYTYIPEESTGGLVVYDDKFAYSHHATDPASGMLCNAFDLVRVHKFGEDSFSEMCEFAENDERVKKTMLYEREEQAKKDFEEITSSWEPPIPFGEHTLMPFPVDALPGDIGAYVKAVAESTQTPVDMAGTAALAILATAMQGKYMIRGKADWTEPVNLYLLEIAAPSERKSAILSDMTKPLGSFENEYNKIHEAEVTASQSERRILERKQKAIEEQAAKNKATDDDVNRIAQQLAEYREVKPLRLFADDITPEKLISVLARNNERIALLSSEAGIFDTLAGAYAKSVNIDVMLKGYSGDPIKVDRIGRESECITDPALTVFLMAQPNVLSEVMRNTTFRGRGLTARFLYSMPESFVGERDFDSAVIDEEIYREYERKIINMLDDERKGEIITLSGGASRRLRDFSNEIEPRLKSDLSEMSDWAGKLVGNTLRIAGLLCRAGVRRDHDFLGEEPAPLENWQCIEVEDNETDDFVCELCGCNSVRFVHVMIHENYSGVLRVGCICAGYMEGDLIAAKDRDEAAKRKSTRKKNYRKKAVA